MRLLQELLSFLHIAIHSSLVAAEELLPFCTLSSATLCTDWPNIRLTLDTMVHYALRNFGMWFVAKHLPYSLSLSLQIRCLLYLVCNPHLAVLLQSCPHLIVIVTYLRSPLWH